MQKHGQSFDSKLNDALFLEDIIFDQLYPEHIQDKSSKHWTPLTVAYKAAQFLAVPDARILDIGSGIGKFCLAGAYFNPQTLFFGVEQRHELIIHAESAKNYLQLSNAHFIYANMTQVNFNRFDHFYFYNSFFENIDTEDRIDDAIEASFSLYTYYTQYLFTALNKRPAGTRLVTYHTIDEEVPHSYDLVDMCCHTLLKMWIKR